MKQTIPAERSYSTLFLFRLHSIFSKGTFYENDVGYVCVDFVMEPSADGG